jgi:cysteine desulfurase
MGDNASEMIYLDNAATTRPDSRVVAAMTHALTGEFGNPSSRHDVGLAAERAVRRARKQVARRLGIDAGRVVFTSGGTEALALAILGTARRRKRAGHILVSAIEHAAVLRTAEMCRPLGHEVETVPVTAGGWVDPQQVAARLRPETFLVAVMHINNESGIVQPLQPIADAVRRERRDCLLLIDAVQSFGVLDAELQDVEPDLLALSAHKLHGPKGSGALVLRAGLAVSPLWGGGEQERGLRTGTENVPGIVGLGVAAELGKGDGAALAAKRDALIAEALATIPGAYCLGDDDRRAPHIVSLVIPTKRSEVLVNALAERGVCVSSGSACQSRAGMQRSHVLEAMNQPADHGVIRLSVSRFESAAQIAQAGDLIARTVAAL